MDSTIDDEDDDWYFMEHEVDEEEIGYGEEYFIEDYQRKSLAEIRGVCSFDYNGRTTFVRASVEDVTRSWSIQQNAKEWHQNIVDREVELTSQCFFIFQFKGHTWTNIIARSSSGDIDDPNTRLLSANLKTRAIYYTISDTACALGYTIYENGEVLEQLETGECYENIQWYSNIHGDRKVYIDYGVEAWVDKLFQENDLLEPSMEFMSIVGYWRHKPGDKITIRDSECILERIDFIGL
jgi:hypothetical protein